MIERDERPLSEIRFAQDELDAITRNRLQSEVRTILQKAGVAVAEGIVRLGCTGLAVHALCLQDAQFVRKHMAGSVCGLPCYVPNHLFCLVHNTVGGLQTSGNKDGPQSNPHPEGLALCSRPLTPEEGGKLQGVQAFAQAEAVKEANAHFGAEQVTEDDLMKSDACPVLFPPFVCREHGEFTIGCRYCLAQSIVEGPLAPSVDLRIRQVDGVVTLASDIGELAIALIDDKCDSIELYVLAGRWTRKLVKE
jgi:hypothetical protein